MCNKFRKQISAMNMDDNIQTLQMHHVGIIQQPERNFHNSGMQYGLHPLNYHKSSPEHCHLIVV